MKTPEKILVIQTSFLGDVILATSMLESLHSAFPAAVIHMVVRKGNEGLLEGHPFLQKVWAWNKKKSKYSGLLSLAFQLRKEKFDVAVNAHRFGSSGFLTLMTAAQVRLGFDKNPFSFTYTKWIQHTFKGEHEIERNHQLIGELSGIEKPAMPKLYPRIEDFEHIKRLTGKPYRCIAPTSVWFTKQWPAEKWVELINLVPSTEQVYLLGAGGDVAACEKIAASVTHPYVTVLAGQLNLLQSAALMAGARMNYVNDSAPMHLASSMNAPVRVVFCSTIREFGFGPLSTDSKVIEIEEDLYCRPCGIHGYKQCPQGHFKCALNIRAEALL